jgi:hypothetical protein
MRERPAGHLDDARAIELMPALLRILPGKEAIRRPARLD